MSSIGTRCHEFRIQDAGVAWRIVQRPDAGAVVMLDVFPRRWVMYYDFGRVHQTLRVTPAMEAVLDVLTCRRMH
jgi:hypothetical protein